MNKPLQNKTLQKEVKLAKNYQAILLSSFNKSGASSRTLGKKKIMSVDFRSFYEI